MALSSAYLGIRYSRKHGRLVSITPTGYHDPGYRALAGASVCPDDGLSVPKTHEGGGTSSRTAAASALLTNRLTPVHTYHDNSGDQPPSSQGRNIYTSSFVPRNLDTGQLHIEKVTSGWRKIDTAVSTGLPILHTRESQQQPFYWPVRRRVTRRPTTASTVGG